MEIEPPVLTSYTPRGAPRSRRRNRSLASYVDLLCLDLLRLEQICEDDISSFWDAIAWKQTDVAGSWCLREDLAQEAKMQLDCLLKQYQYDAANSIYKRKQESPAR